MKKSLSLVISVAMIAWAMFACATPPKTPPKPSTPESAKWNITESIDTPESAYFEPESATLFVSNVAGTPNVKDGKGWISKFDESGNIKQARWVSGFNAPKGLRSHKGMLWVSDLDQVAEIEIASGKIMHKYPIKGAKFLNDVAIADDGTVYVSDMFGPAIYTIKDGKVSIFLKGPITEWPNGLLVKGNQLIVASWGIEPKADFSTKTPGRLFSFNLTTKEKTPITPKALGNLDGLEIAKNGDYIVSDWMAGKVYRVKPDGTSSLILEGFKGSADIGLVNGGNTLVVPRMMENQVSAFAID